MPDYDQIRTCLKLINEEFHELIEAMWKCDPKLGEMFNHKQAVPGFIMTDITSRLVEIADGLGDLIYVVLYTANIYGFDLDPIFEEIQRSNMTKIGGQINSAGKLIKPDTYSPAQLTPIIQDQIHTVRI